MHYTSTLVCFAALMAGQIIAAPLPLVSEDDQNTAASASDHRLARRQNPCIQQYGSAFSDYRPEQDPRYYTCNGPQGQVGYSSFGGFYKPLGGTRDPNNMDPNYDYTRNHLDNFPGIPDGSPYNGPWGQSFGRGGWKLRK